MDRRSRRWLPPLSACVLCALLAVLPLPVGAEEPPRTDALPGTFVARLRFQTDREHGCSQSFENRGQTGSVVLEVAPGGGATLTVEVREITIFGPSLGSFKQGQRDFHESSSKERRVLRGKATASGEQLAIRLRDASTAAVGLPPYGDAEYPHPTTVQRGDALTCRFAPVQAYPPVADELVGAWDTEGQQAEEVPALRCELGEWPELLHAATAGDGGVPLGLESGLLLDARDFYGDQTVVLRRRAGGAEATGAAGGEGPPAAEPPPATPATP